MHYQTMFRVYSHDPAVILYSAPLHKTDPDIDEFLPNRPVTRFLVYSWTRTVESIEQDLTRIKHSRQHDTVFITLNEPAVYDQASKRGLPVIFCNHNCLCDWELYKPISVEMKLYDAVCLSRFSPFKRIELARNIKSLILIGGTQLPSDSDEYFLKMQELMPEAYFAHKRCPKHWMGPADLNKLVNMAKVGLILSAKEGTNYSVTQMLLSGLPIVSTRNAGGRDVWLQNEFCRYADDTPESVKAAVDELIKAKYDPLQIRDTTILLMQEHRMRLKAVMEQVTGAVIDFAHLPDKGMSVTSGDSIREQLK